MTRSITLRFDAICVDCGRSLSAGTVARWFGKGRVSCCGAPASAHVPFDAPRNDRPELNPRPSLPSSASPQVRKFIDDTNTVLDRVKGTLPPALAQALLQGLSPAQLAELSTLAPSFPLVVRLTSGARFAVPAEHAAHIIRCIEESLIDRVRDVMGAAK